MKFLTHALQNTYRFDVYFQRFDFCKVHLPLRISALDRVEDDESGLDWEFSKSRVMQEEQRIIMYSQVRNHSEEGISSLKLKPQPWPLIKNSLWNLKAFLPRLRN